MVCQNLHFHMAHMGKIFLQKYLPIAEGTLRFTRCRMEGILKVFLSRHHADALAAAACRCLYQKRIADFLGIFLCFLYVLKNLRSGNNGHADLLHQLTGSILIAHGRDNLALRADKNNAVFFAKLGKACIFGKKAIAGVNCLGIGCQRCADDIFLI